MKLKNREPDVYSRGFFFYGVGEGGGGSTFFVCFCRLLKLVRCTIWNKFELKNVTSTAPKIMLHMMVSYLHQRIIETVYKCNALFRLPWSVKVHEKVFVINTSIAMHKNGCHVSLWSECTCIYTQFIIRRPMQRLIIFSHHWCFFKVFISIF